MKVLIIGLFITTALADDNRRYGQNNFARYQSSGTDGQYVADDSGSYVPDDSGKYYPDYSGLYKDDGTGRYKGEKFVYQNDASRGGGGGRYSGNPAYRSTGGSKKQSSSSINLIPSGKKSGNGLDSQNAFFGNIPAGTSHNPSRRFPAQEYSQYNKGRYDDSRWRIIKQSGDVNGDGYRWDYETENGIIAEESGKLFNKGSKAEAIRSQGFFKYTGPDNVVYTVTYTADENGFVPQGIHLPTPPPIPDAIRKSLQVSKSPKKF